MTYKINKPPSHPRPDITPTTRSVKEVYPVRTFTLTLKTTDTPTGNDASRRLAMVLKYAGRVQGFKCISSAETTPPLKDYEIEALKKEGKWLNAKETQK